MTTIFVPRKESFSVSVNRYIRIIDCPKDCAIGSVSEGLEKFAITKGLIIEVGKISVWEFYNDNNTNNTDAPAKIEYLTTPVRVYSEYDSAGIVRLADNTEVSLASGSEVGLSSGTEVGLATGSKVGLTDGSEVSLSEATITKLATKLAEKIKP